jgi:hypothetical protein
VIKKIEQNNRGKENKKTGKKTPTFFVMSQDGLFLARTEPKKDQDQIIFSIGFFL